jgi:CBS-domain-containing membrane protein
MYSLMASMMIPAIARVFLVLFAPPGALDGPPSPFVVIPPTVVALLLIAVAMIYDWRMQRRWYPAYVYGGVLTACAMVFATLIAPTTPWLAIAGFLESLGG